MAHDGRAESSRPVNERLGRNLLMPDYEQRMAIVARNISQGRITLVQAVARPRERA